ncbi:MAG: hypothetical protein ACRD1R_17320 [Acidobacteriota bacterium]
MKQALILLVAVLVFGSLLAGEATKTGIVVDVMCGETSAGNLEKAANHTVECSMMENCRDSGFGMVASGQFFKFDDAGNTKAIALLEKTEKEKNVTVQVTGEFEDDTVKVTAIEEK